MPLPKYRKPLQNQQTTTEHNSNPYPLRIKVNSDGNELEYLGHGTENVTYVYTLSQTKKGKRLTLTPEGFRRLMENCTNVAKIDL